MFSIEKALGQAELLQPHKCGIATYVTELLLSKQDHHLPHFCFILLSECFYCQSSNTCYGLGWQNQAVPSESLMIKSSINKNFFSYSQFFN